MTANINDVRRSLANSFNELVDALSDEDQFDGMACMTTGATEEAVWHLRNDIAILICMYDDRIDGDMDSLNDIELKILR